MALIRGHKGNRPCPVCFVLRDEMDTGAIGDLRTTETMKDIYERASAMDSVEERDDLLKDYSLRYIEVCISFFQFILFLYHITLVEQNVFWKLENSDPYRALSFDRLHAFHLGLFEDHIWGVLKGKVKTAG